LTSGYANNSLTVVRLKQFAPYVVDAAVLTALLYIHLLLGDCVKYGSSFKIYVRYFLEVCETKFTLKY